MYRQAVTSRVYCEQQLLTHISDKSQSVCRPLPHISLSSHLGIVSLYQYVYAPSACCHRNEIIAKRKQHFNNAFTLRFLWAAKFCRFLPYLRQLHTVYVGNIELDHNGNTLALYPMNENYNRQISIFWQTWLHKCSFIIFCTHSFSLPLIKPIVLCSQRENVN